MSDTSTMLKQIPIIISKAYALRDEVNVVIQTEFQKIYIERDNNIYFLNTSKANSGPWTS